MSTLVYTRTASKVHFTFSFITQRSHSSAEEASLYIKQLTVVCRYVHACICMAVVEVWLHTHVWNINLLQRCTFQPAQISSGSSEDATWGLADISFVNWVFNIVSLDYIHTYRYNYMVLCSMSWADMSYLQVVSDVRPIYWSTEQCFHCITTLRDGNNCSGY